MAVIVLIGKDFSVQLCRQESSNKENEFEKFNCKINEPVIRNSYRSQGFVHFPREVGVHLVAIHEEPSELIYTHSSADTSFFDTSFTRIAKNSRKFDI